MSGNTMSDPSTLRRVLDAVLLIEADLELRGPVAPRNRGSLRHDRRPLRGPRSP